jgi:hypothetical protein
VSRAKPETAKLASELASQADLVLRAKRPEQVKRLEQVQKTEPG